MSSLGIISSVPHEQLRLMENATKKAGFAAARLSRGDKFIEAGEGVAEQSAGRNLITSKNRIDVAISNNQRAINVMQVGDSIIEQASEIVNRASKLARFASGNQVSDVDRKGYQTEFKGLIGQMESIGNFEYNGIKLFDGSRSGNTLISSDKGNNSVVYDISSVSDFIAKGSSLNKNGVIAQASNIGIVSNIGETHAKASISIRDLQEVGSKLTIDTVTIEMIGANVVANNNGSNVQINIGSTATETFDNIIKALNGSDHKTLSQFTYSLEDKKVANLSEISSTGVATKFDAKDKSMLKITAVTAGSKFNDIRVATANSKAIGSDNAAEWTKFNSGYDKNTSGVSYAFEVDLSDASANVSSNESFKINLGNEKEYEYVFVKNDSETYKLSADKIAVRIGATLNESLVNFANAVNGDTGDHLTTAQYAEKVNRGSLILTAALHSEYDSSYNLDKDVYQFINNSTVKLSAYNGQTAVAGSKSGGADATKTLNTMSIGAPAAAGSGSSVIKLDLASIDELDGKKLTLNSVTATKALEITFDKSKDYADSSFVPGAAGVFGELKMGTKDVTSNQDGFLQNLTNSLNKYSVAKNLFFVLNDAKTEISMFDTGATKASTAWLDGVTNGSKAILWGINEDQNATKAGTTTVVAAGVATKVNLGTEKSNMIGIASGMAVTAGAGTGTSTTGTGITNGARIYLADSKNNYLSLDLDVPSATAATVVGINAIYKTAETGISATSIDLTKLKAYITNSANSGSINISNFDLDNVDLADLKMEVLAYNNNVANHKNFVKADVDKSLIAKVVDSQVIDVANQGLLNTDVASIASVVSSATTKVKFVDTNYNTSVAGAANNATDNTGKLLGNKAIVTVDFSEIADKIAARETEITNYMTANSKTRAEAAVAGLKEIVFDINEIEIAGRKLEIGRQLQADGNVSQTVGTEFTLADRIAAFKEALSADNYIGSGTTPPAAVNNFEKFTVKEVASNKFEVTVHDVTIDDDDITNLNHIVELKMTSADGASTPSTVAAAKNAEFDNNLAEGFAKSDLYISVDRVESTRVYSLNTFLNAKQFSHIVFDPLNNNQSTFSQELSGNFVNTDISLKAGVDGERNSAKFSVVLDNGNRYESEDIYLTGNGGINNKGYKIGSGTEITLFHVGGDVNEVGLSFTIQDSGFEFNQNASSIQDMGSNLGIMIKNFTSSLVDGNVGIQITAPAEFVKDVGLKSLDQFSFYGTYDNNAHLTGGIKLQDKVGLTAAQGYIQINNLEVGDILNINGNKITIGTDVKTNTSNMRDVLLKYLVESKDEGLAKAIYTGVGTDKISITSREKGVVGNAISMSVEKLNDKGSVTINNQEFTKAKDNLNTIRYLGDASDILYVKSGTEFSAFNDQSLPSDMIGGISNISGRFIGGSSRVIDGVYDANSVEVSITIGGQKLSGNVMLNGGSVTSGSSIGAGYAGVGDVALKGTVLELTNDDKSLSLSMTLGDDLLLDALNIADNQIKLDKYLAEMFAGTRNLSVYQERGIAGFNADKVVGTALSALTSESATYNSNKYDDNGSAGELGRFEYDDKSKVLSVKVDGSEHKITLTNNKANKGFGEHFDANTSKIVGGKGAILKLYDDNSDSYLALNLENVTSIDLGSPLAIEMFLKVLSDAFSSNASGGIKYQVGAYDSLSAYLPKLSMDALLGTNWHSINVADASSALISFNKINDVVGKINVYQTQVSSDLSAMSKALDNNRMSYEAMSEAYDDLIKMPFYESSALYSTSEMTTKAAASALQKVNQLSNRIFDALNQ